jgi:hypothetical protein
MIPTGGYHRKQNNQGHAKFDKTISVFSHDAHWVPEEKCNAGHFGKQKYLL